MSTCRVSTTFPAFWCRAGMEAVDFQPPSWNLSRRSQTLAVRFQLPGSGGRTYLEVSSGSRRCLDEGGAEHSYRARLYLVDDGGRRERAISDEHCCVLCSCFAFVLLVFVFFQHIHQDRQLFLNYKPNHRLMRVLLSAALAFAFAQRVVAGLGDASPESPAPLPPPPPPSWADTLHNLTNLVKRAPKCRSDQYPSCQCSPAASLPACHPLFPSRGFGRLRSRRLNFWSHCLTTETLQTSLASLVQEWIATLLPVPPSPQDLGA